MSLTETIVPSGLAASRRAVLRGGLLGAGGLAAAALVGCATSKPEAKPADAPAAATPAGASAGPKFLNQELLALNDPAQPYPYIMPEPDKPAKKGGTFRVGWSWDIASFDPTNSTSNTSLAIPNAVGERLLSFVHGGKLNPFKIELGPGLALSWETSPDGLTYTFKLTDKAKFHNKPPVNGRAFTAEDVRQVYDRYANVGVSRGNFTNVDSMKAVNPTTFQVKLKKPQVDYLIALASREMVTYAIELVDADPGLKQGNLIGTNYMILKLAERSNRVVFDRNPDYWQRAGYLDGSEWKMVPDQSARLAALRAGQHDYVESTIAAKVDADQLRTTNPDIVITANPIVNGSPNISLNNKNPKFKDERIRRALSLGIDRKRLIDVLFKGAGQPYLQLIPWIFAFDKLPTQQEVGPYQGFDQAEAKKLLSAAGQENFTFEILRATNYLNDSRLEFLLEAMKGIGVNMVAKTVDVTIFNSQWQTFQYPEAAGGFAVGYSADTWFREQVATGASINRWSISDPQIDQWADQQSSELDPKKRRDLHRKIWDRMGNQVYRVETGAGASFIANQPWLRNHRALGLGSSITSGGDMLSYASEIWLDK